MRSLRDKCIEEMENALEDARGKHARSREEYRIEEYHYWQGVAVGIVKALDIIRGECG